MSYPTLDELNDLLESKGWAEFHSAIGQYIQERKKHAGIDPPIDEVVVLTMGIPTDEFPRAPESLEELLKAGASPGVVYENIFAYGLNPFTLCLKYGWFDAARVLLKYGAETRAGDHLMIAARYQEKLLGEDEYDELVESIRSGVNPVDQFANLHGKKMHVFGKGWVDIEGDQEGSGSSG